MEINGRFNLTECLFIQYEYTHGACERMVEYMHAQFNVCLHCKYLCVCVCVLTVDHITFKHRNPRHFSVVNDTSHIHTHKIIDLCVTQNSDWLEEGIFFFGRLKRWV